jgi:hypothetical protein
VYVLYTKRDAISITRRIRVSERLKALVYLCVCVCLLRRTHVYDRKWSSVGMSITKKQYVCMVPYVNNDIHLLSVEFIGRSLFSLSGCLRIKL